MAWQKMVCSLSLVRWFQGMLVSLERSPAGLLSAEG